MSPPSSTPDESAAYLTFAEQHVEPIRKGEKTLTARVNFDRDLPCDTPIEFRRSDGSVFVERVVAAVETMTVREFVLAGFEGHRTYESVAAATAALGSYYPDVEVGGTTLVTVIWFSGPSKDTECGISR